MTEKQAWAYIEHQFQRAERRHCPIFWVRFYDA